MADDRKWYHILTDNQGVAIAELENLHNRTLYLPLSRVNTGSFVVDTINPNLRACMGLDLVHVKVYRETVALGNKLMSNGPLLPSLQKTVGDSAKQMTVNFAGIGWRLGRRLIEETKTALGYTYGYPAQIHRTAMVTQIINGLNNATPPDPSVPQSYMDTGVRIGAIVPGPFDVPTTVGPWFFQNALQGILEICSTLDAPEWLLVPTEPVYDNSPGIGFAELVMQPLFGGPRPNCVWEYGDGKHNVASFTHVNDATVLLNRAYNLPGGFPNTDVDITGIGVIHNYDLPAISARKVIYEDVIVADLTTGTTRGQLTSQALLIQKQPKTVITFQPTTDHTPGVVPQFGVDYNLGDVVQFRAVEYGVETVNGLFRIYAVTFIVDDEGNEIPTPTLISQDV